MRLRYVAVQEADEVREGAAGSALSRRTVRGRSADLRSRRTCVLLAAIVQFIQFLVAIRSLRRIAVCLCVVATLGIAASGQTAGGSNHGPNPTKIEKQIFVFPDAVVVEQWPHTLKFVYRPQNLKLLNPGECIRIGIVAIGDDSGRLLEKAQLSFRVEFSGQTQDHALAQLAGIKQLRPKEFDAVGQIRADANVKGPPLGLVSMGASADRWCVPDDAQDGTATIDAQIESPAGHEKLAQTTIAVESFETGSRHDFKDENEFGDFGMSYHDQPNPARLFPFLKHFAGDTKYRAQTGSLETTVAMLGAALKANPAAAKDFMTRVASESGFTRACGLLILLNAGYDIDPVLKSMSEEDRQMFARHPVIPDPFDLTHVEDIGTRLDMLWSIFMSTGQFAPIQKVASALAWRSDWEVFDTARKSASPPKEWTPAIGRAVGYGAAGWALGSFQRTDPLAADYIEFLIASPDTPEMVKTELRELQTDPAFKWQDKK
jgi:hypothetical protein